MYFEMNKYLWVDNLVLGSCPFQPPAHNSLHLFYNLVKVTEAKLWLYIACHSAIQNDFVFLLSDHSVPELRQSDSSSVERSL